MIMVGKRGFLDREMYRKHYQEANEIAAILTSLTKANNSNEQTL